MNKVITYYLKEYNLTDQHKAKISRAMKKHYAAYPMTAEHKRRISEGCKKAWKIRKRFWQEHGWI